MRRSGYAYQCKGTRNNPIPNGQVWTRTSQASSSGCCFLWRGACDWCMPSGDEEMSEAENAKENVETEEKENVDNDMEHQLEENSIEIDEMNETMKKTEKTEDKENKDQFF